MLTAIYSVPDLQYHEFTGPYLSVSEEGRIRSDCKQLFKIHETPPPIWPPPKTMPSELYKGFTMNGVIPVVDNYRYSENDRANGGKSMQWSKEKIIDMGSMDITCGAYNHRECEEIIQRYGERFIRKKKGVVIGSSTPWAEAALLAAGASHITTIEYRNITTNHPNLTAYRPQDVAHLYSSGKWKPVDFIFTYSSVEHDGLGRYGDPLNPYGDLEAFAKAKCLLKPGGVLFVGLPVGPDAILWNAHRQYGPIRFKLMLNMGWVPVDLVGEPFKSITEEKSPKYDTDHPIWLLRKGINIYYHFIFFFFLIINIIIIFRWNCRSRFV
jgi:hypothetical protein